MSKQLSDAPLRADEHIAPSTTHRLSLGPQKQPAVFWPWLGALLLLGLAIVGIVTYAAWNWLNTIQSTTNTNQTSNPILSAHVQRSALYSDLNFTLLDVQYATSFADDTIHAGPGTVRVTLRVQNLTSNPIDVSYYDAVRLLVPGQKPITPTNLKLPSAPQAKTLATGWIDFPLASKPKLADLKLQFGNAALNELLVTIPMSGPYDPGQYNNRLYPQSQEVDYYFKDFYLPGYTLNYHLTGVDVRDSYNGVETKAGQQFYVLNFSVDNPNGVRVVPGPSYYYIRLALNGGDRYPIDGTLPAGFNANAQGVTGHVAFIGPTDMHALTMVFLRQAVAGGDAYQISL